MKHMNYNIPAMAMLAAALIGASSCHRKAEQFTRFIRVI